MSSSIAGCSPEPSASDPEGWTWDLPAHFPQPRVPKNNPMSAAKVELGRHLFYDTAMSANNTTSCATCHLQELAFTDGRDRAVGATGALHPRSSMAIVNLAYTSTLTWANPHLVLLEEQAHTPLFGQDPIEMGNASTEALLAQLRATGRYEDRFAEAFPEDDEPMNLTNVLKALAAFQRSIISSDSPYDRFVLGDRDALSPSAKRGMELFFSERLECFHCHGGFNFSSSMNHAGSIEAERGFHNNGLYNLDGKGSYPFGNEGLFDITFRPEDRGHFKAPTLRNIEVTAPYMHDGSLLTLDDVIAHYARGGTLTVDGPNAGDGALSPLRSPFLPGFILSDDEHEDLKAFLHSLTDPTFLTNPAYASPFETQP